MKVAIIEDERPAVEHLERALAAFDPGIEVVVALDSVEASVRWFSSHAAPDLVLCDIQLADGLALSIFEQVKVRCPVVFCTAYDQYWTEAFAAGGIDYVLKPIEQARLAKALTKYRDLREHFAGRLEALLQRHSEPAGRWKSRFLVKRGLDFVSVPVREIRYFTTEHKLVALVTRDAEFLLDGSLNDVAKDLDPRAFFRANRKYLVNFEAIKSFRSFDKGRVHAAVDGLAEPIVVSQENARRFREWMDR